MTNHNTPVTKMFQDFFAYKVERMRILMEARSPDRITLFNDPGTPFLLSTLGNRFAKTMSDSVKFPYGNPFTEPFKSFDIALLKQTIENKLLLTDESKFEFLANEMITNKAFHEAIKLRQEKV